MKKIAILTTHRANNFGAMLQAYSLVTACRELGADAEILDWRSPFFEWLYHKAWRMRRNPIAALKHWIWYMGDESDSRAMFSRFRQLLPLSPSITDKMALPKIESNYDAFIAGSDQIWNPANSSINPMDCDRTYFLDFVKSKPKYAYAASIGKRCIEPPELQQEFVRLWKSVDTITMREFAGADYVGNCIGRKICTVVDPVLLHDANFWRKSASPIKNAGKYVLLYNIKGSLSLRSMAYKFANDKGVPVVDLFIPAQMSSRRGDKVAAGPAEFLSYIDGADSVFTGSFHASAFSVIYGKKLYVQCPTSVDNTNSRIDTLLSWTGIKATVAHETKDERIFYCDCSQKDSDSLNNEVIRSRDILSKMVQ